MLRYRLETAMDYCTRIKQLYQVQVLAVLWEFQNLFGYCYPSCKAAGGIGVDKDMSSVKVDGVKRRRHCCSAGGKGRICLHNRRGKKQLPQ